MKLPACPVETTLMLIGDKWKVLILRELMGGTQRFGQLKKSIGSVSQKVLTAQLRDMEATGLLTGITRTTGKAEIVRACLDSIAYQITDLLEGMGRDAALPLAELRVDGGPTANRYLMQRQSDLACLPLAVPAMQELSALGAARAAVQGAGLCACKDFGHPAYARYQPRMGAAERHALYEGWQGAVRRTLYH